MKIWTFSDLHMPNGYIDADRYFPSIPDADVCVVVGDLIEGDPEEGVAWLDFYIGQHMPVAYILGNHEFYSFERSMQRNRELAGRAAARTNNRVHVLDDMVLTIDGVKILGTTLWYDLAIFGRDTHTMAYASRGAAQLNDSRFRHRDESTDRWTPSLARQQHYRSKRWLEAELAASDMPTVVVSHHAPHPGSIATRFAKDWSTAGFASDLTRTIEQYKPSLWLHGHMHDSFDYTVGETRIVCNPHGVGRENERDFDPAMIIEIGGYEPKPPGM